MVVGDGTLLVPMWLRGLVQLLMAIVVRIISNSGSMAMVAQILSLMMTTILKLADKEYTKAIANRVPKGPCDCNRGMCVWPSTVGPKPNERRSKGRAARNFANDHRGLGQRTGVWKSQWAHVPGPQGFLRCVGETHVKCLLVHRAEPLPMCAS